MNRRTVITLLLTALATLLTIAFYAQEQTLSILLLAAEQLLYLAVYLLPATLLGAALVRLLAPNLTSRSLRLCIAFALGVGTLGILELLLGLAGYLNTTSIWILLALSAATGLPLLLQSRIESRKSKISIDLPLPALWPIIGIYIGVAIVGASLMPGILWKPDDPHPYDILIYHLQVPREWFDLGRIVALDHNVYSYFPFNVEIHYLAMMYQRNSVYGAMYQAQFLSLIFTLVSALAVFATVKPLSRTGAALAAAAFLLTPWNAMLASVAYVEPGQILFVATSTGCLLAALRTAPSARLYLLAGLLSGFAAGVKLTSLPMFTLPVTLALAVIIFQSQIKDRKSEIATLSLFLLASLLSLSPWLIRNQLWAHNPVFPVAMHQLGANHYTPDQITRFEKAHSPRADQQSLPARLTAATWQIFLDWRFGLLLIPLALLALILNYRKPEAWLCIALVAGTLLVWLFATHLQSRFFTIALPAIAILVGLLPAKAHRYLAALLVLAAACNFTGCTLAGRATSRTGLHPYLADASNVGRQGLFGLPDPTPLQLPEIRSALDAGRTLLFVGDAQIFLQPGPMSQIRYRTVFDVDAADRDLIDAWYGPAPATAPTDIVPVISPSELERLHNTYYAIPPFNPDSTKRFPRVIMTP